MSTFRKLSEVSRAAPIIPFDDSSKFVIMSDCHRGTGEWNDNFAHNRNIHYAALKYYFDAGYTYIELGDTDELWKHRDYGDIRRVYLELFRLMRAFHLEKRLFMLYGNHDLLKRDPAFMKSFLYEHYDAATDTREPLLEGLAAHEGLVLRHTETEKSVFLVHGHQGILLDDTLWRLSRFIVRHFSSKLEILGFRDLTSAAKNPAKKRKIERRIAHWARANNQLIITGHTHRAMCPHLETDPYFNDGSCVRASGINCIEIENSRISLIKWGIQVRDDGVLIVDRQPESAPRKI